MKTRPILFSGPMVRALLNGRKMMTRRIVKPRKDLGFGCLLSPGEIAGEVNSLGEYNNCPYGQPGSRLWVRETWNGPFFDEDSEIPDDAHSPKYCQYRADGGPTPEYIDTDENLVCRWRPSIFMPRWASRIALEIIGVRVERLQDISEADAMAEGVLEWASGACAKGNPHGLTGQDYYELLWSQINGRQSWDANPWVWVIEFRRVEA